MGLLGGLSPGGSIALGIAVGIVSTSVQSLGLTLQRKSHILEDEKAPHLVRRPPHRRRRWQLGMAMFVVANLVGSSIQISTLPLPVLSTLQASGLVFNSICATLILGEPFTRWSLWGTLLVCGGAVLIAVFGAIPAPAHNLDELLALLARPPFIAWMALQAVSVVGVAVCIELASAFFSGSLPPPLSSSSSRSTSSFSSSSRTAHTARFRLARGLTYGCISGVLSAHSLLVAKSAVELVVRTIADGNNQFRHWQAWALVLALVTLALTQLYYLHRGLKLVSTSVLYPLVFCVYNIIAILDGLIYFRQTDLIGPLRGCLISLGTVVLLSGVLALSWRLSDEQHAPAVGQSSLAPGLGLVEDSEGEDVYDDGFGAATDDNDNDDDEETLLLGSDISSDDIAIIDANDEERVTGFGRGRLARGGKRISMVEGDGTAERQRLLPPRKRYVSSYQTFAFGQLENVAKTTTAAAAAAEREHVFSPTSPTLGRRRTMGAGGGMPHQQTRDARWTERAEIWDELEDQDDRQRSSFEAARGPATKRYRSSTLPLLIGSSAPPPTQLQARTPPGQASLSPFSAARRGISGGSPSLLRASNNNNYNNGNHSRAASSGAVDSGGGGGGDTAADAVAGYRKVFRRRRKTTGFPGFHARRIDRRSFSEGGGGGGSSNSSRPTTTGLQDALGGLWRLGWWHGDHSNRNGGGSGGNDDGDGSKGKQHSPVTLVSSPLVPRHEGPPNEGREVHRRDEDSATILPAHAPPSKLGDDSDDDLDDG